MAKVEFDPSLVPEQRDSGWYEELFRRRWEGLGELRSSGQASYSNLLKLNQKAIIPKKLTSATIYEACVALGKEAQFEILIGNEKESGYHSNHAEILRGLKLQDNPLRNNRSIIFSDAYDQRHLLIADFSKDYLEVRARYRGQRYSDFTEEMTKTFLRYGIKSVIDGTSEDSYFGEIRVNTNESEFEGFNVDKIFEKIVWFGIISEVAILHSWTITQYLRFLAFPHHWPNQGEEY